MSRTTRKIDHIQHALSIEKRRGHGFEDVQFVHQSLPNRSIHDVNLASEIGELQLSSPIFINAMTGGGGEQTKEINRGLATVAAQHKLGIAVGSQMAALKDPLQRESYSIVREVNRDGIVIGNLGSEATVEQAKRAVDMLEADGIQIHLNTIQELAMPEGDRDFVDALTRIEQIVSEVSVPVIVKEVGFGMSHETADQLGNIGVTTLDVGGFGGTNFAQIENKRRARTLNYFNDWGISTTCSLAEVKLSHPFMSLIGSGGVEDALGVAKAIALGASAVGIAGAFLQILSTEGVEALSVAVGEMEEDLKMIMTAVGVRTVADLQKAPVVLEGRTQHWLAQRGFDTTKYSTR